MAGESRPSLLHSPLRGGGLGLSVVNAQLQLSFGTEDKSDMEPVAPVASAAEVPQAAVFEEVAPDRSRVEHRLVQYLNLLWQPEPVRLVWTRNRSTFLSMSRRSGVVRIRLHECFAEAPEEVVGHLLSFLSASRRSSASQHSLMHLRLFFENNHRTRAHGAAAAQTAAAADGHTERVTGECFDLAREWEVVRNQWLQQLETEVHCLWGRWPRRPPRRRRRQQSLQLGSYCQVSRCIHIHPVLDHAQTPAWFLRFVLFHEGLHALYPPQAGGSTRRVVHSARFRAAEQAHPDAGRSEHWLQKHLSSLLRRAARGAA